MSLCLGGAENVYGTLVFSDGIWDLWYIYNVFEFEAGRHELYHTRVSAPRIGTSLGIVAI